MAGPQRLFLDKLSTPIGAMRVVADEKGNLRLAFFADGEDDIRRHLSKEYGASGYILETASNPHGTTHALERYFDGELEAIEGVAVKATGTPFQQEVWRALRTIRCGCTTSYGRLAQQIGHAAAVRAVGAANSANPIAVVVPCHRVIGANGSLTGYGGGMERKRWLLNHERGGSLFCFSDLL